MKLLDCIVCKSFNHGSLVDMSSSVLLLSLETNSLFQIIFTPRTASLMKSNMWHTAARWPGWTVSRVTGWYGGFTMSAHMHLINGGLISLKRLKTCLIDK